jgi:hypothetical protein
MNQTFRSDKGTMVLNDNRDVDDGELSIAEINGLIQHFDMDSADTESFLQGVNALIGIART